MAAVWIIAAALIVVIAGAGFSDFATAKSSPQQAAAVAAALLGVVVVYALARAVEGIAVATWRERMVKALAAKAEAPSPAATTPAGAVPAFPIIDAPNTPSSIAPPSWDERMKAAEGRSAYGTVPSPDRR